MEKVRVRISEMPNRCKLVVESSRRARYNNVEEEIKYFGVSLISIHTPVPSILTPTGGVLVLLTNHSVAIRSIATI
jgi:hypothetical protein